MWLWTLLLVSICRVWKWHRWCFSGRTCSRRSLNRWMAWGGERWDIWWDTWQEKRRTLSIDSSSRWLYEFTMHKYSSCNMKALALLPKWKIERKPSFTLSQTHGFHRMMKLHHQLFLPSEDLTLAERHGMKDVHKRYHYRYHYSSDRGTWLQLDCSAECLCFTVSTSTGETRNAYPHSY